MNSTRQKEIFSREIVKRLWPQINLEPVASANDKRGIDGWLEGESVQIKYDQKIAYTGNIYDEYEEKDKNNPEQQWRKAKRIANIYIFVTGGNWEKSDTKNSTAIMIEKGELERAERGKEMVEIPKEAPTSKGYLIPRLEIKSFTKRLRQEFSKA